jgi:hypothetical protein
MARSFGLFKIPPEAIESVPGFFRRFGSTDKCSFFGVGGILAVQEEIKDVARLAAAMLSPYRPPAFSSTSLPTMIAVKGLTDYILGRIRRKGELPHKRRLPGKLTDCFYA